MPPSRGPYNITKPNPPLTDAQLGSLMKRFHEQRKAIHCPNCQKTTAFQNKGAASPKHHNEPHYKCIDCLHTVYAAEMLSLVTDPQPMDDDDISYDAQTSTSATSQPAPNNAPQPMLTNDTPQVLNHGTQPDIHMLFNMLTQLTTQFQQQQHLILKLTEELRQIKQTPPPQPSATTPINSETDYPPLQSPPSRYPSAPWHQPQKVLSLAQMASKNQEQREATAARFFQAPSATQGFQYLYLPTKARIPLGKLRTTFKKLGVNNGRLLDLHYPDRNIVAVLVHNDYATEFEELLSKKGVKLNTTFDPCAASVIKDPKYANDTPEQRQQLAQS
ncbi:hypothetical protein INT46_000894, partial [Mucor plumbeus]